MHGLAELSEQARARFNVQYVPRWTPNPIHYAARVRSRRGERPKDLYGMILSPTTGPNTPTGPD